MKHAMTDNPSLWGGVATATKRRKWKVDIEKLKRWCYICGERQGGLAYVVIESLMAYDGMSERVTEPRCSRLVDRMKLSPLNFSVPANSCQLSVLLPMPRTKRNNTEEAATSSAAKRLRSSSNGRAEQQTSNAEPLNGHGKKQILLNAFDMSTVGHLSPGQWKVLLRDD